MTTAHWYRAFGQLIRSEVELPEYRDASPGDADIIVRQNDAPARLRKSLEADVPDTRDAYLTDEGVLLHIEQVGDFIIRDGREISVSPSPEVEMNFLRLYLVGSAMGMLFHQRRQFIFHGAAVLSPKGVSVFVGPSGAGKSTLTAHLAKAGYPAFADDTLPLFDQDGRVVVWPGAQVFKMWQDALENLDRTQDDLPRVSRRYGKYFLKNPLAASDAAAEVTEVFVLERGTRFAFESLQGLDAIKALNDNTYRPEMIGFLGFERDYLQKLGHVAGKLRLTRFTRPDDATLLPQAVEHLQQYWETHS